MKLYVNWEEHKILNEVEFQHLIQEESDAIFMDDCDRYTALECYVSCATSIGNKACDLTTDELDKFAHDRAFEMHVDEIAKDSLMDDYELIEK